MHIRINVIARGAGVAATMAMAARHVGRASDGRERALADLRARLGDVLPRHVPDVGVVEIAMVAALRRRSEVMHTLFGRSITRYLDDAGCSRASIGATEFGQLVGIDAPALDALDTSAFERSDALHSAAVAAVCGALQTTLGPPRCQQAWESASTRCASVLAARMDNAKEVLEAIFGPIPKVDVRRLGAATENLTCDEDEDDAYILSTCDAVRHLARAIVA